MNEILRIENVCKKYPSFSLKNVSFDIKPGQIMGFIGRNGAGKSTTINSMLSIVRPDEGKTVFFSTHITSDLEKCADSIIYIHQGEIRASCSKADFIQSCGQPEESLEEIFLRLEREASV